MLDTIVLLSILVTLRTCSGCNIREVLINTYVVLYLIDVLKTKIQAVTYVVVISSAVGHKFWTQKPQPAEGIVNLKFSFEPGLSIEIRDFPKYCRQISFPPHITAR